MKKNNYFWLGCRVQFFFGYGIEYNYDGKKMIECEVKEKKIVKRKFIFLYAFGSDEIL